MIYLFIFLVLLGISGLLLVVLPELPPSKPKPPKVKDSLLSEQFKADNWGHFFDLEKMVTEIMSAQKKPQYSMFEYVIADYRLTMTVRNALDHDKFKQNKLRLDTYTTKYESAYHDNQTKSSEFRDMYKKDGAQATYATIKSFVLSEFRQLVEEYEKEYPIQYNSGEKSGVL